MSMPFDPQLFRDYFTELWEHRPFPWQERLAAQVIEQGWPSVIDLPTANGKTACIDIAVFALACERGPRRIFFIVDRKVIVDEAFSRAEKLSMKLKLAKQGRVHMIANRLRALCGDDEQELLRAVQLRGGIFRDESWVRSPLQPMVIASTVDQVGSRLLFRGYGIGSSSQPIHAGLIGNDSLLLLDEAHCSKAFAQTLEWVEQYRGAPWRTEPHHTAFTFVEMSATPSRLRTAVPFTLDAADREDKILVERLSARKMTRFVAVKAKTDDSKKLAADLVREARAMAAKPGVKRVAVMVNRVDTAREVAEELAQATLVIGRMRPVDRTSMASDLQPVHSGVERLDADPLRFIVSTQCLEVGADLDFDALVTELASMDALLQRFGRLNRLGGLKGGAFGCIVAPAIDPKKPDPIYGPALTVTRHWLESLFAAQPICDFGLEGSEDTIPRLWKALPEEQRREMVPPFPRSSCPVLWPSHLDALVQTSPKPVPEPEVSYFLHGEQSATGDVSVVWRSDLDLQHENCEDILALCPPVVGEALPVRIWVLRAWMNGTASGPQMDEEGGDGAEEAPRRARYEDAREILIWRGKECNFTRDSRQVRPGDMVILPATLWPVPELGYVPASAQADVGDQAFVEGRGAVRLRIHPAVTKNWPETAGEHFKGLAEAEDFRWEEDVRLAAEAALAKQGLPKWLKDSLEPIANGRRRQFTFTKYPGERKGWIIESKNTLQQMKDDDGLDEPSRGEPVSLREHIENVEQEAHRLAAAVMPPEIAAAVKAAARWHDAGKADERFQALLFGGNTTAAQLSPALRAKGEFTPRPKRKEQRERSGIPDGFRHELTSLLLAEQNNFATEHRDLILHLVASHHGYCRPFAPVVLDNDAADMCYGGVTLTGAERQRRAAHVLDRGVAERFWGLTRRYGWCGLAYLESLLRLTDWRVSADEQKKRAAERTP